MFPAGIVVDVITFPAESTGALVKAYEETPKSELLCPALIV
jgi:hypothetical protein